MSRIDKRRGARIAPDIERGRVPVIEATRQFKLRVGRKTPDAFFWVEWDPANEPGLHSDTVLVMAEPE